MCPARIADNNLRKIARLGFRNKRPACTSPQRYSREILGTLVLPYANSRQVVEVLVLPTRIELVFQPWQENVQDAMHGLRSFGAWSYQTDIPAPPPTDLPEDQHDHWIWSEYDLKKKYSSGTDFEDLIAELQDNKATA